MLSPAEIKQQAVNRFPDVVHARLNGQSIFPWDVRFGRADTSAPLKELREQVELLLSCSHERVGYGYRVNLTVRRTRRHHEQALPDRVWFETESDYLRFIGREEAVRLIAKEFADFYEAAPEASAWLQSKARTFHQRIAPGEGWALGLAVHALHSKPQPQCFARELFLPGVSGKFVEMHIRMIAEILQGIGSPGWREGQTGHVQLGLKETPRLLRIMLLDGNRVDHGVNETFFAIPEGVTNVLVVENLRSFLTLPPLAGTLAIYGEGRAAETLSRLPTLQQVRLFYWGDMDVYGYSILNALRGNYPHVESVLMDRVTFDKHANLLSACEIPSQTIFNRLLDDEKSVSALCSERKLGIEQEKLPPADVQSALLDALTRPSR